VRYRVSLKDVKPSTVYSTRRRNDDHENVGLDVERSINQSLYHYLIVRPNADYIHKQPT